MSRGDKRERDRAKAQARQAQKVKSEGRVRIMIDWLTATMMEDGLWGNEQDEDFALVSFFFSQVTYFL